MSDEKDDLKRRVDLAIAGLNKNFGKNTVMQLGDVEIEPWPAISTGALTLDVALGIGGLPEGRIVEIYGPASSGKTTLALMVSAEAQRLGKNVCYIDMEHALDPAYAKALGVNMEDLYISQPSYGEQALTVLDNLVGTEAFGVIVVDSVAALVPKAELDGEIGQSHVGGQARLMGQALRKVTARAHQTNTMVIFINQIREKIGVMFGCFHYDARVKLADGSAVKIGTLVNQRMDVEVLSFNEETGKIEPRRVVDWHDNGDTDEFIQVTTTKGFGKGVSSFGATRNHKILTPNGYVEAGELKPGDVVMGRVEDVQFTGDQWQVIYGSILGDGSIRPATGSKAQLRVGHGPGQIDYAVWKSNILGSAIHTNSNGTSEFDVRSSELLKFAGLQGRKFSRIKIPLELIDSIDARGIAIWYMDDGSLSGSHEKWGAGKAAISVKSIPSESVRLLMERLVKLDLGIPHYNEGLGRLTWSGEEARLFFEGVAPFIPDASGMRYKLPHYAPEYSWAPDTSVVPVNAVLPQEVLSTSIKPPTRSMKRFDITVEGNHNYLIDDVIVHNSPETTPGGRALPFYASVRIDVRKKEIIKLDGVPDATKVKAKVVKNKMAAPFKEAEFDILYGRGIDSLGCIVDMALLEGVIKKSGAWYEIDGASVQGRPAAIQFLASDLDLADKLKRQILTS